MRKSNFRPMLYRTALRAYYELKGLRGFARWKFLEDSQWWSKEQIMQYQDEELRKLIEHSYAHVAYYRNVMDQHGLRPNDIKSTGDLVKLPVLTKDDLRIHWKEIVADNHNPNRVRIRKTGGSMGKPLSIMVDYVSGGWEMGSYCRGLGFSGYQPGEKMVVLFGGSLGIAPQSHVKALKKRFAGEVFLPAYEISRENVKEYVDKIASSGARFINGYTSALFLLAKFAEEKGLQIALDGVFPTSETLHEYQRDCFERVFHAEVFNLYGCGECNSIAFECPLHNVLHPSDEHVVTECLRGGARVNGEMGSLTLTTLHNYAFPLIRYQNGDIVSFTDKSCPCGRGLSSITSVHGRESEMLVTKDCRLISSTCISNFCVLHDFEGIGIQQYQVVQKSKDLIQLTILKSDHFRQDNIAALIQTFRKHLGEIEVVVRYVDSIPLTVGGKHRYVINEMDIRSMLVQK